MSLWLFLLGSSLSWSRIKIWRWPLPQNNGRGPPPISLTTYGRGARNMERWILGLAVALAITQHAGAYPLEANQIRVIDGDTIAADGRTVHLVGFIAPEMHSAQC